MGSFKFGRRKRSGSKSSKNSSLYNDKESINTPNSKATSTRSVPTLHQMKDVSTKDSPLKNKNKSRRLSRPGPDVGNYTEPILSPRSNSAMNTESHSQEDNNYTMSKTPLMPEITSIKSQRTSGDRPRSLFRSRRHKHGELDSEGDDDQDIAKSHTTYQQQFQQQPRFNPQEPALLSLPLIKTDSLPVTDASSPPHSGVSLGNSSSHNLPLVNEPIAESSPNQLKVNTKPTNGGSSKKNSFTTSEIETPIEVEAHMANTDSTLKTSILNQEANNSGIFSNFLSAAHNAASHLGNITSSSHPEEFKSHPPTENASSSNNNNNNNENGNVNSTNNGTGNGTGTSFMQHLDSLLFSQSKNKSRDNSADHSNNPQTQDEGDNDNDDRSIRSGTQSIAHDVVFQPIRKNALSTMGKGELTLEALGFTDSGLHNDRTLGSQQTQVPMIAVDNADEKRVQHSNSISGTRDLASGVQNEDSNGAAMSKVMSGPSALGRSSTQLSNGKLGASTSNANISRDLGSIDPKAQDESFETMRSASPVSAFRRSISPINLKMSKSSGAIPTQDSLAAAGRRMMHRRSVSSVTEDHPNNNNNSLNPTTTSHSVDTEVSSPSGTPMSASFSTTDLKDYSYANQKRDKEFHSMFKKIPSSEKLLDDYSCALQRDILVQGRMYITEKHICFNANILGWTTNINIPIQEIVQLEKKNTAGLFPNGIIIQTLHQKYIFASFLVRDTTFDLITNIWVKLVRGPTAGNVDVPVDFSHSDSDSNYNGEDGYSSDDDYDIDDDSSDELGGVEFGPSKHSPTEFEHKEVNGETKIKEDIIEAPLGKVFNSLFGDDSNFFKSILESQKNKEISTIPKFISNQRKYTYVKPLNSPVGPKETKCHVSETIEFKDFKSYVLVTQTTKTPDVPSGNSFSTNTQIYLSWGPKNSTSITVFTSVQWTAKSWIKGAVEKGSVDGQKESMNILVDELKSRFSSFSNDDDNSYSDGNDGSSSSLPTIGPSTHEPTDNEYKKNSGDTQIADEIFNAPLGTIYSILFGDDSSYLKSIIEAQKNVDISSIPNFSNEGDSIKQRNYQYVKPLNGSIGPKQTRCLITETIDHFDINKYILVTQSTKNPDVPSGNSFTVQTKFYFSWGSNNSTRLLIITSINWTAKSWIKGPIEKGTIDGQNESVGILTSELKSILTNAKSGKKSKKKNKNNKSRSNTLKEPDDSDSKTSTQQDHDPLMDFLNRFQSPYIFGIMIFLVIFLFFILRKSGTPSSTLNIDGIQKIMIDGREYMIMPSVEDSLKKNTLREQTEYEVWKWINERTKSSIIEKNHKYQDLNEMVNLAENHLKILKEQISRDEASDVPSGIL
ncbi:GRAM domain-containing protein YSP2 [Wickerhamomyces ciferrii]|uniref:GRAM domain-containing protein YSP2 n=1 Tax=Wickerhamomyces ciferrii (strain ATCC 14091 / BCRC 22168 / CBS 111 / JCM 3599 / NBRC 0793 / NRRL Y-1031 F-60-10) TaxID=1206466 RepID=K0KUI8_WICCF|nr:GRAM domain-containing protein YSP2 [Wickerhamomyces ciferrii]CCH46831.1 GRAM domain-containing protein YSP2 [Wickerhamomyces ciferrii]